MISQSSILSGVIIVITILILKGDTAKQKNSTFEFLLKILDADYICKNKIKLYDNPNFLVVEINNPKKISGNKIIAIPTEDMALPDISQNDNNIIWIIMSHFKKIVNWLKDMDAEVITCGMIGSDTVTFSSFTHDSCVISVQRQVKTIFGNIVQPIEIPMTLSLQYTKEEILQISSALILSEQIDNLTKKHI